MIDLQDIITTKRELLSRETYSRNPINYSACLMENLSNRFVLGTKYLITFSRNGLRILAKKWLQSGLMVSL